MHGFTGFTTEPNKQSKAIMKEMVNMAKKKGDGGEEFKDMDGGELQRLIDITPGELTEDDLMVLSASELVPDDKEDVEEVPENKLTLDNWQKGSNYSRLLFAFFYDRDPSMTWVMKLKQTVVEGLVPYRNILREIKKQNVRKKLNVFL